MSLLDTASLLLTPNAYKEGKLYSVIPSDGSGDFTFTRATTATRVNSDGLVELVPYNLLQRSNTFNNAIWQLIGTPTITANYDTNPLTGENDAWRFQSSGTSQRIFQSLNNSFCTFSLYAKGSGNIKIQDSSGTYGTTLTLTSSWQRFLIYIPASFTNVQILSTTGGCDATIYGAQVVEGTNALPYQKTETRLNIPRLDYSLGGCPNILLEPQRTNLIQRSSEFDSATWVKLNATVTANAATSPSGVQDADRIQITNATINYLDNASASPLTNGTTYTVSVYARSFGATNQSFRIYGNNNKISPTFTATPTWQRFEYTFTATSISPNCGIGSPSISDIVVWGAQLEAGSYATSYIPTTTASVTRNAEVCSKTGITSLIGQTEGTIFFDGVINGCQNAGVNILNSERNTNASFYLIYIKSSSQIRASLYSSGAEAAAVQGGSVPIGSRFKVAYAYKSGSSALYINGVQITTSSATFTLPNTIDDLYIADQTTYFSFGESVRNNATTLWKTRLTNAELAQLTTI